MSEKRMDNTYIIQYISSVYAKAEKINEHYH